MWRRNSFLDSTWKGNLEACSQEEPRLEVISKGRAGTPLRTREQGFLCRGWCGKACVPQTAKHSSPCLSTGSERIPRLPVDAEITGSTKLCVCMCLPLCMRTNSLFCCYNKIPHKNNLRKGLFRLTVGRWEVMVAAGHIAVKKKRAMHVAAWLSFSNF